uniref:ATP synthase protein 8 n=1 Tax=Phycomyces blakesleeanus TaxID=4837 RepID=A0A0K1HNN6_PHYBL|nr:ATP synthase F0 subunit 8 [Phycomyces blakesleeanus]AKT93741.1 ATP synthase F0 subunit 8 [Phycomyces blakesleeanus]
MPQLVPFYFLNQVSFAFLLLMVLLYVVSKYILPNFMLVQSARMFLASK